MKGEMNMLEFIIMLGILSVILWIGYKVTGALFTACIWLFIKVPCAIVIGAFGVVLCITILLIPIGIGCCKFAVRLLLP